MSVRESTRAPSRSSLSAHAMINALLDGRAGG
jgi:hypothetical protein